MTRALHEAHLAMCAGQGRDIGFETEARVSMDDYRAMIEGKTAALFGAACELGALAAGAEPAERAAPTRGLGRAYGVAFQIEDDVLGTWGDPATTGKPCGADLAKRKWTFPVVWALAGPPSPERDDDRRRLRRAAAGSTRRRRRGDRRARPARRARGGAGRRPRRARRRRGRRRRARDRPQRPRPRVLRPRRPPHRLREKRHVRS